MNKRLLILVAWLAVIGAGAVLAESITQAFFDNDTYGMAKVVGDSDTKTTTLTVGNITVTNAATLPSITTTGDLTVNDVTASGTVTASSNLTVNGNSTIGNATSDVVNITGVTTISGYTVVTNASGLVVVGPATAGSLTVNGAATATSATVGGLVTAGSGSILTNLTVAGVLTGNGNVAIGNATTDVTTVVGAVENAGDTNGLVANQLYLSNGVLRVYR